MKIPVLILVLCLLDITSEAFAVFGQPLSTPTKAVQSSSTLLRWFESASASAVLSWLDNGNDPNQTWPDTDETILMHAVLNPNPNVTRLLLAAHANIHAQNYMDADAAFWAVTNPNLDPKILEMLFAAGIDPLEENANKTNLFQAAANDTSIPVLQLLLDKGINIRAKDDWGQTALMYAAAHNTHPEVIRFLVNVGLKVNDVNSNGQSSLALALQFNTNPQIIQTLLELGGDVLSQYNDGNSILELAEQNKSLSHTSILKRIKTMVASAKLVETASKLCDVLKNGKTKEVLTTLDDWV